MFKKFLEVESDRIVHLENISVCYKIPIEPIRSLKEYAIRFLQGKLQIKDLWALSGINLDICKGEVLGIIGNNGAGKSTLLKVVSKILLPTNGVVEIIGVVSPMLEIGAGFHLELTGKENILLNGTLLGHTRRDIERHFDAILDFAEIGDLINAPVRTYSSGMVARLGFAVATAWRPDILILDEVLSVGDKKFQQKCLARIKNYRSEGSTILLVTHNLDVVKSICTRAIWLEKGILIRAGDVNEVLKSYKEREMIVDMPV